MEARKVIYLPIDIDATSSKYPTIVVAITTSRMSFFRCARVPVIGETERETGHIADVKELMERKAV